MEKVRLRYENRNVPYYTVVKEFFADQLTKFIIDNPHECQCNMCGKNLTQLTIDKISTTPIGNESNHFNQYMKKEDENQQIITNSTAYSDDYQSSSISEKLKKDIEVRDSQIKKLRDEVIEYKILC